MTFYNDEIRDYVVDKDKYPFFSSVPSDPAENVRYRQSLYERAMNDVGLQRDLREMCRADTLFFIQTFCWLFEPRPRPRILPFVLWPHQIPVLVESELSMGMEDVALEKSRGEGASWLYLTLVFKWWMFETMFAAGLVSRSEEAVDDPNDSDSLMWKLDWHLKKLPYWLKPGRGDPKAVVRRTHGHTMKNCENDATVVGYSAVGDVASGGRKTCFLMDEMAKFPAGSDYDAMSSTQFVTDCRYIISTFKGNVGAYYDAMRGSSSIKKLFLDWRDNPDRNRGLYEIQAGNLIMLDPENNPLEPNYKDTVQPLLEQIKNRGYQIEERPRSPWYDRECARTNATPSSIAEELDRDPTRSGTPYFDIEVIERLLKECRPPFERGDLDYTKGTIEPAFIKSQRGRLHLWVQLSSNKKPPTDRDYVIGVDIAAGGGGPMGTNSAFSVAERKTGKKVAEYTDPAVYPHEFAKLCYAASKFFEGPGGPAYLIHESNGTTGAQFTRAILELEHPNLFMQSDDMRISGKRMKRPGFHNQGEKRGILYGGYRAALAEGRFSNLSREAVEECKFYEHRPGGGIEHASAARKSTDPSGAGHNHGDRCTADALACRGVEDFSSAAVREDEKDEAPSGSFLHRRQSAASIGKSADYW